MTLEEVAMRAGVSTGTVSRVLNRTDPVRDATRKRVLEAVDELQYRPNLNGRSLAAGSSRALGRIVSNIENPCFLAIFCALEQRARGRGYAVMVEQTDHRPERLVGAVRSLIGFRPVGLAVVVSETDPSVVDEIAASDLRAVFYDVGRPAPNILQIRVRYQTGMRCIVEYLYSLAHRRLAFLGHHAGLAPLNARRETFINTVKRHGPDAHFVTTEGSDWPAGGLQSTRDVLASDFRPTAIVCTNDFMAIGGLRACREAGLHVPHDVSVTGFDNIELASYTNPPLTTANVPRVRVGELCLDALLGSEKHSPPQRAVVIEPDVVIRESTGPVRHIEI